MTAVSKFLFDRSFDVHAPLPKEEELVVVEDPPEDVVPTFIEDDVNAARRQGFAEGKAEGIRESAVSAEATVTDALAVIGEKLSGLFQFQEEVNATAVRNAVTVATTIARKLFPGLNRLGALGEIEMIVERSMERITDQPRVSIYVGEHLLDALAARMDAITAAAGYRGEVALFADAGTPEGDCRVEWTDGGAERNAAAVWQDIDDIIERNLGVAEHPSDAGPDARSEEPEGAEVGAAATPEDVEATPTPDAAVFDGEARDANRTEDEVFRGDGAVEAPDEAAEEATATVGGSADPRQGAGGADETVNPADSSTDNIDNGDTGENAAEAEETLEDAGDEGEDANENSPDDGEPAMTEAPDDGDSPGSGADGPNVGNHQEGPTQSNDGGPARTPDPSEGA